MRNYIKYALNKLELTIETEKGLKKQQEQFAKQQREQAAKKLREEAKRHPKSGH